eukprot:CAMPEP_0202725740 /NCGR_PEP_ID=MMETSP1385-20130828/184256_1 /ASSEMBLY_ACC=CAM_ASM_000861 /TAXON_ID=933848 /ORGANISM="Elphidium margaritaceum" /LENGTH=465 /DNA_ID=CAMNT_0049391945 /DNA_START=91 /DNA_END=1488 /DNA_ORIENTATION=+
MPSYEHRLKDDNDYTLCTYCNTLLSLYNNASIASIAETLSKVEITRELLRDNNSLTSSLLQYRHMHCEKCGLYIEIHPICDDICSSKIFICNHRVPHNYALCYHCGLLYGMNPNPLQKTIDVVSILRAQSEKSIAVTADDIKQSAPPLRAPPPVPVAVNPVALPTASEMELRMEMDRDEEEEEDMEQHHDADEGLVDKAKDTTTETTPTPKVRMRKLQTPSKSATRHDNDNDDDRDSYSNIHALKEKLLSNCNNVSRVAAVAENKSATRHDNDNDDDRGDSYSNIHALKEKLLSNCNNVSRVAAVAENITNSNSSNSKTVSCPSSPLRSSSGKKKAGTTSKHALASLKYNLSYSSGVSPLLGPSTPSPRVLAHDVDDMDRKWQQYLLSQKEEKRSLAHSSGSKKKESIKHKLEAQQSRIDELEKMLDATKSKKSMAKENADIYRRGAYSSNITLNHSHSNHSNSR